MPGSFTDWAENAVLDSVFGRSTTGFSTQANGTVYLGLYAGTIADTHTATSTGECAGSTYARLAITNSSTNWANSTAGSKENKAVFTVTTSAGSDWGTITGMAILNTANTSAAAGQMIVYTTLTGGSKVINSGDTIQVSSTGGFVITLT